MKRRTFIGFGLTGLALQSTALRAWSAGAGGASAPGTAASGSTQVTIDQFSPAGKNLGTVTVPKVVKSDDEWRAQLSPSAFNVTRKAGTEYAYSGEYASNHTDGIYHCVCCDTALFDAKTKFESGTGWPSFYAPISPKNIVKSSDTSLFMQRDAISCRRCDAHLGHVFDDGPRPTGLRYCMNSVALKLVARG